MKKLTLLIIILLSGCGTSQQLKTSIVNTTGVGEGTVLVENAGFSGGERAALFYVNDYCRNLQNGYGVKDFYRIYGGGERYTFNCVIRIPEQATATPVEQKITTTSIEKNQSNSNSQCKEFGFSEGSANFSNCVLQLELAKKRSAENEARYNAERAEYERQLAAIEREKERRRGAAFLELGARMMGGQRPIEALGSLGTGAPIAPSRPSPINQTITLPGGRMISCTTMGTMTNCF